MRDILALCVVSLLLLGVIMVQSAATNITGDAMWSWTERGQRHLIYAIAAIATFYIVGRIDYLTIFKMRSRLIASPIFWLMVIALVSCILVLVPGIGMEVNGARRWLKLGPIQVQPSEMAKWSMVIFLSYWIAYRPVNMDRFFGFLTALVPVGFTCLLIVIQDFGTAALIGACALAMLVAGRAKWWHLAMVVPPALCAAFWFVRSEPYRWKRMTAFLDPYANPEGEGYHMIQSLLSFATGGVYGKGLGNGIQKLGYLPEDTTDFIFAVVCEELGLFGALLVIALYLGVLFVAWQTMRQKRDGLGRILAFGVSCMLGMQAAINMAVATVSVPTKGMSLPLISAGGSGLVITCAALGLLYSVTRHHHTDATPAEDQDAPAIDSPLPQKLAA